MHGNVYEDVFHKRKAIVGQNYQYVFILYTVAFLLQNSVTRFESFQIYKKNFAILV